MGKNEKAINEWIVKQNNLLMDLIQLNYKIIDELKGEWDE